MTVDAAVDLGWAEPKSASVAEQLLGILAQYDGDLPTALRYFDRARRTASDQDWAYVETIWLDQADALLDVGCLGRPRSTSGE